MIRIKQEPEFNENFALEIFSSESYLTVNKSLLRHYGPDITIFLSNLIDKYKYFLSQEMTEEGWFYILHQQQMEDTGLTLFKLQTCKSTLIQDGVLETKRKGVPSKEWYHLNLNILLKLTHPRASSRKTPELAVGFSEGIYIRNNKPKEENNNKPKNNTLSDPTAGYLKYLPLANQLYDIILIKKKIHLSPKIIEGWAKEFCQLIEKNQVSISRVQEALSWYEINIEEEFTPVIESGKSFREKFIKLEDAIKRKKYPSQSNKPVTGYREKGKVYREADQEI
jgi:hypothetical protein